MFNLQMFYDAHVHTVLNHLQSSPNYQLHYTVWYQLYQLLREMPPIKENLIVENKQERFMNLLEDNMARLVN